MNGFVSIIEWKNEVNRSVEYNSLNSCSIDRLGIALLNSYCKKNIHVQHPALDHSHMVRRISRSQLKCEEI